MINFDTQGPTGKQIKAFIAQWRALEVERRDFEYRRAQLMLDIRRTFPSPPPIGDQQFMNFVARVLEVTAQTAKQALTWANAASVAKDVTTYQAVIGKHGTNALVDLTTEQQLKTLNTAKAASKNVATVVREQRAAAVVQAPLKQRIATARQAPVKTAKICTPAVGRDLRDLARWVHLNCKTLPPEIRTIVEMYK